MRDSVHFLPRGFQSARYRGLFGLVMSGASYENHHSCHSLSNMAKAAGHGLRRFGSSIGVRLPPALLCQITYTCENRSYLSDQDG